MIPVRRSRRGAYTLMEVIVVMSLVSVLAVSVAAAMSVGTRTTLDARQRLSDTSTGSLIGSYFRPDVQNVSTPAGVVLGGRACDDSGAAFLTLVTVSGPVSYMVGPDRVLLRKDCTKAQVVTNRLGALSGTADPSVSCTTGTVSTDLCRSVNLAVSLSAGDLKYVASRRLP